jgi:PDZ domain
MILYGVPMLTSRSQSVWKTATETAIRDEVISILNNQVESVAVEVDIVSQSPEQLGASTSTAVSRTRRPPDRLLQLVLKNVSSSTTVISSDLSIVFDVKFFIRAVIEDHNVRRYVGATLDTPGDQNVFMLQLKASGEAAFEDLTAIRLVLPPADSSVSGMLVGGGPDTLATGMTVGIAVVSVAGTALIVVGVYMWAKRRPDQSQSSSEQMIENMSDYEKDIAFEVTEKPDVEVSTLGDPIPQGLAAAPMDPASIAEETTSLPYDYKVAAHALPSLDESGSYSFSEISSNILDLQTDDDTLDAQYFIEDRIEVEVPPGFLGLVLEEDSEGIATVYDMKELSPVADRVHIGDKLISVDDIDITAMPVRSVMQLIASKQSNPIRKFVFTRPSKKLIRP